MSQTTPTIDYARKWLVLAAVGAGIFLGTLNGSIVNIALPTLVREFNTTFQTVQWVVLGFLLTTAALLLSMGKLGDIVGKKPVYVAGLIIFTVSSALCGLAPTLGWLIAFRVLQAVGAAMTQALGLAIATEAFPPEERGLAVGYAGGLVSLGVVAGPTLGGFIIDALSWPWIFLINVPIGIIGLILVLRFVPNLQPTAREPFDFLGAGLLLISLVLLLLSLTQGQAVGFQAAQVWYLLSSGLALLLLFVLVELRLSHPMVDLRLFGDRLFTISLLCGLFVFTFLGGVLLLLPFYLEDMLGYSTQQSGLLIGLVPIILSVLAPIAGALSDRVGTRSITVLGLLVIVVGYLLMRQLSLETSTLTFVLLVLPFAAGLGIFQSPNNSAVLGSVGRSSLGVASGMLAITRTLGTTIGTALLGTIWTARITAVSGGVLESSAISAPISMQVAGLQDTFTIVTFVMLIPLALSLWGWWLGRRQPDPSCACAAALLCD
jgi:EmrB/QacA subfamily drug resistance transporter